MLKCSPCYDWTAPRIPGQSSVSVASVACENENMRSERDDGQRGNDERAVTCVVGTADKQTNKQQYCTFLCEITYEQNILTPRTVS